MAQTTKKVKYIGTEQYINARTGEIEEMQVTSIEDRDYNFSKVWMRNFIATLDIVGNQKTKLCFWIIEHVNKQNVLIGTMRSISKESGISLETVRKTMSILLDADFLRRVQNGVYIINPDIVFKGSRSGRMNVLNQYNIAAREELTDEEKLSNLMDSITKLLQQAEVLKEKIASKNNQADQLPGQQEIVDTDMHMRVVV